MKFHWSCDNPKCLQDNITEVENVFVQTNGGLFIDLKACKYCGNPHRKLRIWNQRIELSNVGVSKY